jgi:SAM-dependent methyltransferase
MPERPSEPRPALPRSRRPRPPTVAERRFAERAAELSGLGLAERFARMYETNLWSDADSRSGTGSNLGATERLRAELPGLLRRLGVRRLVDVPCGDFHWMAHVDLAGVDYVGADIVEALVESNRARYAGPGRTFVRLDLTTGPIPAADAVLCRDCLVHLSFANIARAFRAVAASGARYLITTTFLEQETNSDVVDGDWRPLNLERAPFHLPPPEAVLVEGCDEEGGAYADKALAAWRVASLPDLQGEPPAPEAVRGTPRRGES